LTQKTLSLHCYAGITTVYKIGDLAGYEDSIANILSLNKVKTKYWATYGSAANDCSKKMVPNMYLCPLKRVILLKC